MSETIEQREEQPSSSIVADAAAAPAASVRPQLPLHLPSPAEGDAFRRGDDDDDEAAGATCNGSIISVSYAKFDTRLGNTIALTFPTTVHLTELVDAKNLQDYCFPDGAHGNMSDCVCATLRRRHEQPCAAQSAATSAVLASDDRSPSSPPSDAVVIGGAADADDARALQIESSSSTVFGVRAGGPIFAFSFYHQKRDANADRGATQRAILILTTRPMYHALVQFCKSVCQPFFDAVPMAEHEAHEQFTRSVFLSLANAFSLRTGRADWSAHARSRVADAVDTSLDQRGTMMAAIDRHRCDQRVIRFQVCLERNEPTTDPHLARFGAIPRIPLPLSSASSTTTTAVDPQVPLFECDIVLPVALPANEATVTQQLCFGASLKQLLGWFGPNVAVIHWCMLTRVPVLFIGASASAVGEAVRACAILMQPLDVDVLRFAPYCTLEHVDYFSANMASSVFLALGSTNAYVCHKEFPGAAKCHIESGKIEFADGKSCIRRMPKSHHRAFDDLCVAARDPRVAECYIRARAARFNLAIMRQMSGCKGAYYETLGRISNLIEQPLDASARGDGQDDAFPNGGGDDATDRGFLLVENNNSGTTTPPPAPTSPSRGTTSEEAPSAGTADDVDEAAGTLRDALATDAEFRLEDPVAQRRQKLLKDLTSAIGMFEEHSKRNHQMIVDVDAWYKDMSRILKQLSVDSEVWHQGMVDELANFSALDEAPLDPSVFYCNSDLCSSCASQRKWDRTQRLRIVQDYKERVFLMIDALSKNNTRALLRRTNRHVIDFFQFGGTEGYALPTQVLLHTTSCRTVWYIRRTKVSISGTIHLTRNYLLFEASSFAIRKRHQIVPFDCVHSVAKDKSSTFSTTVKVLLDIPTGSPRSTSTTAAAAAVASPGDARMFETADAAGEPLAFHQGLLLISSVGSSDGFYQLLHALTHRQRRLVKLMEHIPPPHTIPQGIAIGHMFIPRTIPVGLYSAQEQWFYDEVWENQRVYPIVGWSSKLLLNDPSAFSDFSCTRSFDMGAWALPEGFRVVYDWRLAKEARQVDPQYLCGVLSDEQMLSYGKVSNPFQRGAQGHGSSRSSRRARATGAAATTDSTAAAAAEAALMNTGDRSPRGASRRVDPNAHIVVATTDPPEAVAAPETAPVAAAALAPTLEWLYNNSWVGIDSFRTESFLGCTVRRRLWVRVRKLSPPCYAVVQSPPLTVAVDGSCECSQTALSSAVDPPTGFTGVPPQLSEASALLLRQRTLSTSSSDVVESPRQIANGVMAPLVEEEDDG